MALTLCSHWHAELSCVLLCRATRLKHVMTVLQVRVTSKQSIPSGEREYYFGPPFCRFIIIERGADSGLRADVDAREYPVPAWVLV